MYETYYGLTAKPFQILPDPRFYFGSKNHERAKAYLQYGVAQAEGFIVVTGDVGTGKTTLIRQLMQALPRERVVAAQIVNTSLSSNDVLHMVAENFGLQCKGLDKPYTLAAIEHFLRASRNEGKKALLIVDEAQNLSLNALEQLRMLSNIQTDDACLLQIFLVGQPQFRKMLADPEMQQLRQRVIASYHLSPLSVNETRQYIEHRLALTGWTGDPSFSDSAFEVIHQFTAGIPRRINTFCDRLLVMGFLEELHCFDTAEVDQVVRDIEDELKGGSTGEVHGMSIGPGNQMFENDLLSDCRTINERLGRIERALNSMIDAMAKLVDINNGKNSEKEPYL